MKSTNKKIGSRYSSWLAGFNMALGILGFLSFFHIIMSQPILFWVTVNLPLGIYLTYVEIKA